MLRLLRRHRPAGPEPTPVRARRLRDRIATLETERLEILADERVPGRKHRLDALTAAQRDLRTELDDLPVA